MIVPIEPTKKTVRICSVDEEIRIESFDSADMQEPLTDVVEQRYTAIGEMPELRLVTAKIVTAEEIADSISRREKDKSPVKVYPKTHIICICFVHIYLSI